jgi:alpha-amylase
MQANLSVLASQNSPRLDQEQGFSGDGVPVNREALWQSGFRTDIDLYQFVKLMNQIRRHAINVNPDYLEYQSHVIYSDNSTIAYRKGFEGRQIVSLFTSGGEKTAEYDLDLPTAFTTGTLVTDVVSCTNYTVNQYGQLTIKMGGGMPRVFFPGTKMNGSALCGFSNISLEVVEGGAESLRQGGSMASSLAIVIAVVMAFCLI